MIDRPGGKPSFSNPTLRRSKGPRRSSIGTEVSYTNLSSRGITSPCKVPCITVTFLPLIKGYYSTPFKLRSLTKPAGRTVEKYVWTYVHRLSRALGIIVGLQTGCREAMQGPKLTGTKHISIVEVAEKERRGGGGYVHRLWVRESLRRQVQSHLHPHRHVLSVVRLLENATQSVPSMITMVG